ncbi:MAG: hypothetical protein ACP5H3_04190, partial [Candidatus Aenigmatarchaeota archaeon]
AIEYAEGWLETGEWNYEVGERIREIAEKEGVALGTNEYIYDVFEPLSNEWISGYADYIMELKEKLKR